MDLGVFLPIANNGWILSRTSPQYMPSFELNREITLLAERTGFDFVLSMVKWRGFGGETEFWDHALESLTLMAGLAAVTTRIGVYASVQPLTLHPAVAARMCVTVDDISKGRFGLNIVSGWYRDEYTQMGLWPGDHFYDERYDYAEEWLTAVTLLWREGRATFQGKYFTLADCMAQPRPSREIPIICAGMSDRGVDFTVRHGHINFVGGDTPTLARLTARAKELAQTYGRAIKTYSLFTLVPGRTDAEARALYQRCVDGADLGALEGLHRATTPDTHGATAGRLRTRGNNPFMSQTIAGSAATIVDRLEEMSRDAGIDGYLFSFPDFIDGVNFFGEEVMPRLLARGLRPALPGAAQE